MKRKTTFFTTDRNDERSPFQDGHTRKYCKFCGDNTCVRKYCIVRIYESERDIPKGSVLQKSRFDYSRSFFNLPIISFFAQPTEEVYDCRINFHCEICDMELSSTTEEVFLRRFNRVRITWSKILNFFGYLVFISIPKSKSESRPESE